MAALIIEATKQRIPLGQGTITIGRGPTTTVRIQDPNLADLHCQIVKNGTSYCLISMDPKAGTLVNGTRIREHALRTGDAIQIGTARFLFEGDPKPPSPTTAIRPTPPPPPRPVTQAVRPPTQAVRAPTQSVPNPAARPATQAAARPSTRVVKPPTSAIPRPVTQAAARPPTQAVPRPVTQAIPRPVTPPAPAAPRPVTQAIPKPVTQRQPSPTARQTKRAMTRGQKVIEQAKIDLYRRRVPPGVWVVLGFVGFVAGGIGLFMLKPDHDKELEVFNDKKLEILKNIGSWLEEGKYAEAKKGYRQILAMARDLSQVNQERLQRELALIETKIKQVEADEKQFQGITDALKKMEEAVQGFKTRLEQVTGSRNPEQVSSLKNELNRWILANENKPAGFSKAELKAKGNALVKEAEEIRKKTEDLVEDWPKISKEFDRLSSKKENQFRRAKEYALSKKALLTVEQQGKLDRKIENLPGMANLYVNKLVSLLRPKLQKEGKPEAEVRAEFEKEWTERIGDILPETDKQKAWSRIQRP